jgi:hypothetical protein
MDTAALVNRLIALFVEKKNKGLIVDAIGLAPAYHGMVRDRYVLGVSAPSLRGKDNYDKISIITDALFESLAVNERIMINRVRVYNNIEELNFYKENDFEEFRSEDIVMNRKNFVTEVHRTLA